jgi:hypothetical protein
MTRMSKEGERRHFSPKKRKKILTKKTGSLPQKAKEHANALEEKIYAFIPKIKGKVNL